MKKSKEYFSDEILNAYIDGELGTEESSHINLAMKDDELLRRRVNDLKKVSELVRAAFEDVSPPEQRTAPAPAGTTAWRIAATVAFVSLGALLGWNLYSTQTRLQEPGSLLIASNLPSPAVENLVKQIKPVDGAIRVMFHVSRNDLELLNKVLNETDRLLFDKAFIDKPVRIRVIASHGGLTLFQRNYTDYGKRIRNIKLKYQDQVEFIGCGETLNYMQAHNSIKRADLLPELVMVDSGVADLLRRQQLGWTFVLI